MAVTKSVYVSGAVEAARSVLIELVHLLGEYRDSIVVVGGWVPGLILHHASEEHIGTLDVDLAVDHSKVGDSGYRTIKQLLESRGYYPHEQQPFIFFRDVVIGGQPYVVEVDLLSGEYGGTGKGHRTQRVQDVKPRKARGCDLAFELREEITLEGDLPEGGRDRVNIPVAAIVPFLVMKGMALADRLKEKDAYDVYYCVKNYPEGIEGLIDEFRPHLHQTLVQEGLDKIGSKFSSPEDVGPKFVADFEALTDPEMRALVMRDAFERVSTLVEQTQNLE